ncbi:hypothetical protein SEN012174_11610 [Salmonella enterica subsp. enterica serovar Newport]|nr:hypothetical protein SEN012174_11610 [Salmonella enterica subsp. enterica serovar Newport]
MHGKDRQDNAQRDQQQIAERRLPEHDPAMLDEDTEEAEITGQ